MHSEINIIPQVYFAGKMIHDQAASPFSSNDRGWEDRSGFNEPDDIRMMSGNPKSSLVRAGPWTTACGCPGAECFAGDGTHGKSVGANENGCTMFKPIRERSMKSVLSCALSEITGSDAILVCLDAWDAYGTIAELGYAYGLEMLIFVDVSSTQQRKLFRDTWFCRQMAVQSLHRDKQQASKLFNVLRFWFRNTPKHALVDFDSYVKHISQHHWKPQRMRPSA